MLAYDCLYRAVKKARSEQLQLLSSPCPRDPTTCKEPYYEALKFAHEEHNAICTSSTLCGGIGGCNQLIPFKDLNNPNVHQHKDITHIEEQLADIERYLFEKVVLLTYAKTIVAEPYINALHKILCK